MNVTQEKLPASQLKLTIEVPEDLSAKVYESTLKQLASKARIPGFRQGKVPRKVLLQQLGSEYIKGNVLQNLLDTATKQAIEQENLKVLGNYQMTTDFEELMGEYQPGQPFTFTIAMDVVPEVVVRQYRDLTIPAEEVAYDPAQVEAVISQQRKQRSILVPVDDRPAALGDVAIVDFKGIFTTPPDGQDPEIPGGSAQDFQMELEEDKMIPGFVEGIVGMNPGETRELVLDFPEDYAAESMAGQNAKFTITLQDLKIRELPPLDDAFAQSLGDYDSVEDLQSKLEAYYKHQADQATLKNKAQAVKTAISDQVDMDPPESLVEQQCRRLLNQVLGNLQDSGQNIQGLIQKPEQLQQLANILRPQAIEELKQELGIQKIASLEGLKVSAQAVDEEVRKLLAAAKSTKQVDKKMLRNLVQLSLVEGQVIDWMMSNNTIELVPEGTLAQPSPGEILEPGDPEAQLLDAIDEAIEAPALGETETEASETEA
jgi:trigger factor